MKTSKTLLLVEDDPNDRFLFARAARKAGIADSVHSASDGQHAINYLNGSDPYTDRNKYPLPDLVVLDLKLPLSTGFEVLSYIRQHSEICHVPVVIMTSSPSEADLAQAYTLGANAYVVKPPSPEELLILVLSLRDFWLTQNRPQKSGFFPPQARTN